MADKINSEKVERSLTTNVQLGIEALAAASPIIAVGVHHKLSGSKEKPAPKTEKQ